LKLIFIDFLISDNIYHKSIESLPQDTPKSIVSHSSSILKSQIALIVSFLIFFSNFLNHSTSSLVHFSFD